MKTTLVYTVFILYIITMGNRIKSEEITRQDPSDIFRRDLQQVSSMTCDAGGPYQFPCSSSSLQLSGSASVNCNTFSWHLACYSGTSLIFELTSTLVSPSFTYGVDFYITLCDISCEVSLTVTDMYGATKSCNSSVTVSNPPELTCDAGGPYELPCSDQLQLTSASQNAASYAWSVVCSCLDGQMYTLTSTAQSPLFVYGTDFTFPLCDVECDVSLTVTSSSGSSAECNTTVSVSDNATMSCSAGGPYDMACSDQLQLTSGSLNAASYSWDIYCYSGAELVGELMSELESPLFVYGTDFNFTLCNVDCDASLTVSDSTGAYSSCNTSFSVTEVVDTTPQCNAGGPYDFPCNSQLQLTGAASANADTFSWDIICYGGSAGIEIVGELMSSEESPLFLSGVDFNFTFCDIRCDATLTISSSDSGASAECTSTINVKDVDHGMICSTGGPYDLPCSNQLQLSAAGSQNAQYYLWNLICYGGESGSELVGELSSTSISPLFLYGVDFNFTLCDVRCDAYLTISAGGMGCCDVCDTTITIKDDVIHDSIICDAGGPYELPCSDRLQLSASDSQNANFFLWHLVCYDGFDVVGELIAGSESPIFIAGEDFNFTLCDVRCEVYLTVSNTAGSCGVCNSTVVIKEVESPHGEHILCDAGGPYEMNCSNSLSLSASDSENATFFLWNVKCYDEEGAVVGELADHSENPSFEYGDDFNFTLCHVNCVAYLTVSNAEGDCDVCNTSIVVTGDEVVDILYITVDIINPRVSCDGAELGMVNVSFTGGLGPWTISFSDGQEFTIGIDGDYFVSVELDIGVYEVTITSSDPTPQSVMAPFEILSSDCDGVIMDFDGKSTQIKIYQPNHDGSECRRFLKIKFESIYEIDDNDNIVKKTTTLANCGLQLIGPLTADKFGAEATFLNIKGDMIIKSSRQRVPIDIHVWFFRSDVEFTTPDGSGHKYSGGTLKFDVDITGYPFESPNNRLVMQIDLLTPGEHNLEHDANDNSEVFNVPLGGSDDASVFIPKVVDIDGEIVSFEFGFESQGSHTELRFIFPSHQESMHYDPVLHLPRLVSNATVKVLSVIILLLFLAI
jgi:hypothetical protein